MRSFPYFPLRKIVNHQLTYSFFYVWVALTTGWEYQILGNMSGTDRHALELVRQSIFFSGRLSFLDWGLSLVDEPWLMHSGRYFWLRECGPANLQHIFRGGNTPRAFHQNLLCPTDNDNVQELRIGIPGIMTGAPFFYWEWVSGSSST